MIYLDHAATTPVDAAVMATIHDAMAHAWGNPSSLHPIGQEAGKRLRQSRLRIAQALGAAPTEILFASCGSEANNWALDGALQLHPEIIQIIISPLEHPAVFVKAEALSRARKLPLHLLPALGNGLTDLSPLENLFAKGPALFSMMLVNNETGIVQPVEEAVRIARRSKHRVIVHGDAVQALGKVPVDLKRLDVDLASFSGHKIGAPKGVACLYKKAGLELGRLVEGGGQELGLRGGTENTAQIAGLAVAVEQAVGGLEARRARFASFQSLFLGGLKKIAGIEVNGDPALGSGAVLNFSVPGLESDILQIRLGAAGLCVSGGAACSSGARRPSRILSAMGFSEKRIRGALRVSFGEKTTEEEVVRGLEILAKVLTELKGA